MGFLEKAQVPWCPLLPEKAECGVGEEKKKKERKQSECLQGESEMEGI